MTRRKVGSGVRVPVEDDNKFFITKVEEQNITKENFNISKADIEIVSDSDRKALIASVKFCKPDKYLISIKSKTGIEVARIYITNDTLLINDRFNRIQYYGSPGVLYDRYGITNELFSLVFGDYKDFKRINNDDYICKDDILEIICAEKNTEIIYRIDCSRNKVIAAILKSQDGRRELIFTFTDFMMMNNISLAQEIKLTGIPGIDLLKISIRKIDFPWEGVIEFIPGNRYEKIEIL